MLLEHGLALQMQYVVGSVVLGGRFGFGGLLCGLPAFLVARLACLGAPAASGGSAAFPAPLLRFANCWSAVGALI